MCRKPTMQYLLGFIGFQSRAVAKHMPGQAVPPRCLFSYHATSVAWNYSNEVTVSLLRHLLHMYRKPTMQFLLGFIGFQSHIDGIHVLVCCHFQAFINNAKKKKKQPFFSADRRYFWIFLIFFYKNYCELLVTSKLLLTKHLLDSLLLVAWLVDVCLLACMLGLPTKFKCFVIEARKCLVES